MANQIKVDDDVMNQLLREPGVAENVAEMTPATLATFKRLLVKEGIYQRYYLEKMSDKVKEIWRKE